MCRLAPGRIQQIEGDSIVVELDGRSSRMVCGGIEGLAVGDYVACYAGVVVERLEPEEAAAIFEVLAAINEQ